MKIVPLDTDPGDHFLGSSDHSDLSRVSPLEAGGGIGGGGIGGGIGGGSSGGGCTIQTSISGNGSSQTMIVISSAKISNNNNNINQSNSSTSNGMNSNSNGINSSSNGNGVVVNKASYARSVQLFCYLRKLNTYG